MLLSLEDRERVERAVKDAEARTTGEIVCVVAEEASDYSEVPLIWAAFIAFAAPSVPLTLAGIVIYVREVFFGWTLSEVAYAHTIVSALAVLASVQFVLFIAVALVVSIPGVRRFLTPGFLKRIYVRQRAAEQFISKGLASTTGRTGVLLYTSLKDRCVELIADEGIDAKVGSDGWRAIVRGLTRNIRSGRTADGLITAIAACGHLLAQHFPVESDNPNELSDALTELPIRKANL